MQNNVVLENEQSSGSTEVYRLRIITKFIRLQRIKASLLVTPVG
jgi:hypothetical protein